MDQRFSMQQVMLVMFCLLLMFACGSCTVVTDNNPPADHTTSKLGAMHQPGLGDPLTNCVSCHGDDLRGGTVGVSCFGCHGQKW